MATCNEEAPISNPMMERRAAHDFTRVLEPSRNDHYDNVRYTLKDGSGTLILFRRRSLSKVNIICTYCFFDRPMDASSSPRVCVGRVYHANLSLLAWQLIGCKPSFFFWYKGVAFIDLIAFARQTYSGNSCPHKRRNRLRLTRTSRGHESFHQDINHHE
jgi:hypothetical protein